MLAAVMPPHNDFHALARYLILGKSGKGSPDRVAWCKGHNLATDDPLKAAVYMSATAELSRRCQNAVYHTIISWHEREKPPPEVMQEIAFKTLQLAGLGEHEALVMGHGDTPHRHLHMMINRVHPVTGRAWATSHDYRRFDRIMRDLSESYGFEYVPSHSFDPDLTDDKPKKPNKAATYAAKHGADTNRLQWSAEASRTLGERVSEHLDRATSWDDIAMAFADMGLTLEPKGQGLVVGDATSYSKFSALGLAMTANSFAKKFDLPFRPKRADRPPEWSTEHLIAQRYALYGAFAASRSWEQLEQALASHGVAIDRSGKIPRLRDDAGVVSFTELDFSVGFLERQFANPSHGLRRWDTDRLLAERDRLQFVFGYSQNWLDLESRLALEGLSLEPKGKGFVVFDATGEASLSSLGWSKAKLEAQFANPLELTPTPPPLRPSRERVAPRRAPVPATPATTKHKAPPIAKVLAWVKHRSVFDVDAVTIARALGTREDIRDAVKQARAERTARVARLPLIEQLLDDLRNHLTLGTSMTAAKRKSAPRSRGKPAKQVRER